jgi:hypothetical protein
MSDFNVKEPWPKIQFRTESGHVNDGYLYHIMGDSFWVSQNPNGGSYGLAQNWVISWKQIIKFYDEKYGLKCTCDAHAVDTEDARNKTHWLTCKWQFINTDLL